jgi:hypothetical protein
MRKTKMITKLPFVPPTTQDFNRKHSLARDLEWLYIPSQFPTGPFPATISRYSAFERVARERIGDPNSTSADGNWGTSYFDGGPLGLGLTGVQAAAGAGYPPIRSDARARMQTSAGNSPKSLSLCLLFSVVAATADQTYFSVGESTSGSGNGFRFGLSGGMYSFTTQGAGGSHTVTASVGPPAIGTTELLVLTVEPSGTALRPTTRIYLAGNQLASGTASADNRGPGDTAAWQIRLAPNGGTRSFALHCAAIWSRTLAAPEISVMAPTARELLGLFRDVRGVN